MSFGRWFGYQVLMGAGAGMGFQAPITAVQTVLSLDDTSIGTVIVVFSESLGGALSVSLAQSVFQNGLIRSTAKYIPELDPQLLLHAGATELRQTLAKVHLEGALDRAVAAYAAALQDTFRLTLGLAGAAFVVSCFWEWRSVKKAGAVARAAASAGEA